MGKINGGNRRLRAEAKVSKGWIARSLITGRSPAKLQRVLEIAGVIPGGWSTICQSRSAVTGPGSRRQCCQAPIFNVSAHLASMRVPPKALSPVSKSIPLFSLPPNLNNSVYTISLFQSSNYVFLPRLVKSNSLFIIRRSKHRIPSSRSISNDRNHRKERENPVHLLGEGRVSGSIKGAHRWARRYPGRPLRHRPAVPCGGRPGRWKRAGHFLSWPAIMISSRWRRRVCGHGD